jgi:hypothetical protein
MVSKTREEKSKRYNRCVHAMTDIPRLTEASLSAFVRREVLALVKQMTYYMGKIQSCRPDILPLMGSPSGAGHAVGVLAFGDAEG